MHKNKFLVNDALYVARVLGRSFIEPRVAHARLVGVANATERARSAKLALHHYFDLQPLCARFRVVSARTFERAPELTALWDGAEVVEPRRGRSCGCKGPEVGQGIWSRPAALLLPTAPWS